LVERRLLELWLHWLQPPEKAIKRRKRPSPYRAERRDVGNGDGCDGVPKTPNFGVLDRSTACPSTSSAEVRWESLEWMYIQFATNLAVYDTDRHMADIER
jgi:hypothetical protein